MMKKVNFKILSILVIFTFCFSFSGFALKGTRKSDQTVTLRLAHSWTGSDVKAPIFAAALKNFEAQHPNIKVTEETASGDDLRTNIKVNLASNSLPDVFTYWGGSILKPLVDNQKVLNIDEYLKLSKTLKKSDISDGAWTFYTFNKVTYGIPVESYYGAFIVNKDLFKKYNLAYPKTEKDLLNVAKVFNAHGIVPLAMGSKGGNPSHFYFSELYNQLPNGTNEIKALSTSYKFATGNALKVAQIIDEQRKGGVFPKDTIANGDWAPTFELYNSGKAAMIYTYPWEYGSMKADLASKSEVIPVPTIPGATKNPASFISSSAVYGIVINKDSFHDPAKQAAIVALVDFMTSEALFKDFTTKGGMVPARNIKIDLNSVAPMTKKVYQYVAKLDKVPDHFNTFPEDSAFTQFQNSMDELFAGSTKPSAFVKKVQDSLDKSKK